MGHCRCSQSLTHRNRGMRRDRNTCKLVGCGGRGREKSGRKRRLLGQRLDCFVGGGAGWVGGRELERTKQSRREDSEKDRAEGGRERAHTHGEARSEERGAIGESQGDFSQGTVSPRR